MPPEGMVHALEKIHGLLKPGGSLIDIRPSGDPPEVEVHVDGHIKHAGWYDETDEFVEYSQAQDAMDEAIERGLFVVEREGDFEYLTHASSVVELRDYLMGEYSDAIIDDETVRRGEELLAAPGREKGAALREITLIFRLRRA